MSELLRRNNSAALSHSNVHEYLSDHAGICFTSPGEVKKEHTVREHTFLIELNRAFHCLQMVHTTVSAVSRDRRSPQQVSYANHSAQTPAPYGPFTCAQARLVSRAFFSHTLHKYGVHRFHSSFLKPWMMKEENQISEIDL